jgi:hypothetical protein
MLATGLRSGAEVVRRQGFDRVLPLSHGFLLLGTRRRDGWGSHREPEAREDGLGGLGRVDGGEDPHATPAARAAQDVDGEDAAQEIRPREPPWPGAFPDRRWQLARGYERSQIGAVRRSGRLGRSDVRVDVMDVACTRHVRRPDPGSGALARRVRLAVREEHLVGGFDPPRHDALAR